MMAFSISKCLSGTREACVEQFPTLNLLEVAIILIITSLHFALM